MSKQMISWHEECLSNMRASYERRLVEVARMQEDVDRLKRAVTIYEDQIKEAKARGMDGFDGERFLKTRRSTR